MQFAPHSNLPSRFVAVLILSTIALAACSPATATGVGSTEPAVSISLQQPDEVLIAFLDAWNSGDYQAMYTYVHPESRVRYPFSVFQAKYEETNGVLGIANLSYEVNEPGYQGASAAVRYDLRVETDRGFGVIDDLERTVRLVQSAEGWRIAWSPLDIFDGLAAGARVEAETRPQARANIYDRDGELLVEENGTLHALYVIRDFTSSEDECLDLLAHILRRQRRDLVSLLSNFLGDARFYVGEIDADEFARFGQDLSNVCGVNYENGNVFDRQTRRYFAHGAAAHVTGYIGQIPAEDVQTWQSRGYHPGDLVGLDGVEGAYEDVLAGRAERVLRIVEPGGLTLRELAGTPGEPPQPVTLTVDRDLQLATAQAFADAYNYAEGNWAGAGRSSGGSAVVIEVNSGRILALASYPAFDPSVFNPDTYCCSPLDAGNFIVNLVSDVRQPLTNRAIQQQYAPGSIFKIVTTAAAANEGIWERNEVFYCDMEWHGREFGDTLEVRYDWRFSEVLEEERYDTGEVNIVQALMSSCDPFFYQTGALLYRRSPNLLVEYARHMGLGGPTNFDERWLTDEAAGQIPVPTTPDRAITEAIGQGDVQVTPLQMARLVAAIANGGTLYRPYLVERIGGVDGAEVTFQAEPEVVGELDLSEEALAIVREGMCGVTTDTTFGTADFVFEGANYVACGKTGTSQTSHEEPHSWFVSYAPAENSQIAVAVMVEYSREGSEVAAPIARRIIDSFLGEPYADYPNWWSNLEYIPLNIRQGGTGGG